MSTFTLKDKINYLLMTSTPQDLGLVVYSSGRKLREYLENDVELPEMVVGRINAEFTKFYQPDALIKPKVKNYDDEDLEDLKAGQSRHGVNRSTRSFGSNNNGWGM